MSDLLNEYSEDFFIESLQEKLRKPEGETIGIGDDCAVVDESRLLKVDCVVEGRHYLPETDAKLVGRKAIARVMSDFAAMGGRPHSFLVTCGFRASTTIDYVTDFYMGMDNLCAEYGGYIVGGETCSVPEESPQFFSITGYGECSKPVLRSEAELGDGIYVTGELGNSFSSNHHLNFIPRLVEAHWLMENARPSAMMDLSDGLAKDLPRLTKASEVGYKLDLKSLPLRKGADQNSALADGEDYELLFTLSPQQEQALGETSFPVTKIGVITSEIMTPLSGGWDHLQS